MKQNKPKLKIGPRLPLLRRCIARHSAEAVAAAEAVAEFAELAMQEFKSSACVERFLADAGFTVRRPWKESPTAFRATIGKGKPAIAILAEYDALPDCGRRPGQTGHGCGHNLLGAAAALAAIAAAETLQRIGSSGRIIVFGCPAEEALTGKVLMAELGAFRGLDAVLCWHPWSATFVNAAGGAAVDGLRFRFRGRTAHAAGGPQHGRSALDAALLMDVAVNYLREHVAEDNRMHSVITDGGKRPNVVPDKAEIWYFLRAKNRKQIDDLRRRVALCARGAALATETRLKMIVEGSLTERIPNAAIAGLLEAVLGRFGRPKFTPADARALSRILPGRKYPATIAPTRDQPGRASSDEDNVSWFAPLGCVCMACVPEEMPFHHRNFAAAVRLGGAHRGMLKAAEVLAGAAVELAINAPLLRKAKQEFKTSRRSKKYDVPKTSKLAAMIPPPPD